MRFFQVDVFATRPYTGNPLAVFPDAADLTGYQMQQIAAEMNLSETTFVSGHDAGSYEMRIFTPDVELPFAGHPTLGTAWVLHQLGYVTSDEVMQQTAAGPTKVSRTPENNFSFERTGRVGSDLGSGDVDVLAESLGLDKRELGIDASSGVRLTPAIADAGLPQLLVPLADEGALSRAALSRPVAALNEGGVYCYTFSSPGRISARGFFPGMGITEDPATGSAAACLGLLLADRVGAIRVQIEQGVQMGRPSEITVEASTSRVSVSGAVVPIFSGELQQVPEAAF